MKRWYQVLEPIESKPARLVASAVLSIIVMTFINGFIGGMGGIPALIAFVMVFYRLRVLVSAGKSVAFREGLSDRGAVCGMMAYYGLGYLLLWALLRGGMTFSRVTGWGNLNRSEALAYVRDLLSGSLMEQWVYLFAGMLMFSFIMSLFPLVVIRRQSQWAVYALMDGAAFAVVCSLIGGITRLGQDGTMAEREATLVDCLLVSDRHALGQVLLYLMLGAVFLIAVTAASFLFACRIYRAQKGLSKEETSWRRLGANMLRELEPRQLKRAALLFMGSAAAVAVVAAIVLTAPADRARQYKKVAEFLTEDDKLGPMEYRGRLYLPVERETDLCGSGTPKGYLARKGEDCDSRLYELTVANILYTDPTGETPYLQVSGDMTAFAPAALLEEDLSWQSDTAFVIWDEEWQSESSYSHELTGYTVCEREFVEALEEKYGQVDYRAEDFDELDAYFSLYGYPDMDAVQTKDLGQGHWIGCILVRADRFYYGSCANEISGKLRTELLDILGGYGKK